MTVAVISFKLLRHSSAFLKGIYIFLNPASIIKDTSFCAYMTRLRITNSACMNIHEICLD